MALLQRGFMFVIAAGAMAVPTLIPQSQAPPAGEKAKAAVLEPSHISPYSTDQVEYYLSQDQMDYVRPGLNVTFVGAPTNFAPGQKPTVEFKLTDNLGGPLDRLGIDTPGAISMRFVPAVWDATAGYYTNLLQPANGNPTRDTAGTFTQTGPGQYKYTFALALNTFDTAKPATIMLGARRSTTDIVGKDYWVNAFKDFLPTTGAGATTWNITTNAACLNCHDATTFVGTGNWPHGGNYRDVKTCMMCHNPNNMASASLAEFNGQHFWHLIHSGQSADIGPITYPQEVLNNCDVCHDAKAAGGGSWYSKPSRAACTGCHTNVDFATGANHGPENLPQADDSKCATCHAPQGDAEWDASIKGAHTVPAESTQLKGLKAEIVSVDQAAPGKKPVVTFKLSDSTGALDPKPFGSNLNVLMGGPTTDYAINPVRQRADGATFNGTLCTFTFTTAIPADAKGTWAFSIEARRTIALKKADGTTRNFTEGAMNPVTYAAVDGNAVVQRRAVVDQALCLKCHGRLPLHGGQRLNVTECIMCHNPNANDSSRRPASGDTVPESISFQRMIHRIHTGEELHQDYTVYGFYTPPNPPNPVNFNEVTFPGDRRNCVVCHRANTFNLQTADNLLDVQTPRDYMPVQGPGTAACLGCHDGRDQAAHAYLMTAPFGEACASCHGANSDWSPSKAHAR